MDAFGWWLLGSVAKHAVFRAAKAVVAAMLGRVLGSRFRTLRDAFRELDRHPGRGDVGARLIEKAPDFGRAVCIFDRCRHAPHAVELECLYSAMSERLRREGLTQEVLSYFADKNIDVDLDDLEYEKIKRFEWAIATFEELLQRRD